MVIHLRVYKSNVRTSYNRERHLDEMKDSNKKEYRITKVAMEHKTFKLLYFNVFPGC